jgi:hypothetical protein
MPIERVVIKNRCYPLIWPTTFGWPWRSLAEDMLRDVFMRSGVAVKAAKGLCKFAYGKSAGEGNGRFRLRLGSSSDAAVCPVRRLEVSPKRRRSPRGRAVFMPLRRAPRKRELRAWCGVKRDAAQFASWTPTAATGSLMFVNFFPRSFWFRDRTRLDCRREAPKRSNRRI